MLLNLSEQSTEPLHGQISRQIRARILAGRLAEGDSLPSIRVMARLNQVSVITIKRAYEDLEHEGLVHARRGKGFFVSPMTGKERDRLVFDRFRDALRPIIRDARAQGLDADRIHQLIDSVVDDED
ncbi:GntR family transcriptional regulator [Gemmatimonadota bacterium]